MPVSDTAATRAGLALVALFGAAACSVLPRQDYPRSDEREVVVRYDLSDVETFAVQVPASGTDLTVVWMDTEPPDLRESFERGERRLHTEGNELVIRCHYRVYERLAPEAGQRGLPPPEQLFPGATSIETVWRRDDGHAHGASDVQLPRPR